MKSTRRRRVQALVAAVFLLLLRGSTHVDRHDTPAADATERIARAFQQRPLMFEANRGQTDRQVDFVARGPGYTMSLSARTSVFTFADTSREPRDGPPRTAALRMTLVDANGAATAVGTEELPGRVNYLIGNDPARWRSGIPTFARATYRDVYPGIDVTYYGNQREFEYDFVVAPGADPRRVRLAFEGARDVRVDASGDLVLDLDQATLRQHRPRLYQERPGGRQEVAGRYVMTGAREVGFRVDAYDATRPLVIDPVLAYATYLGGSGADQRAKIAVDGAGSVYVTGVTSSADFPITAGAFQTTSGGGVDVFVAKLDETGSLVYATYLGGADSDRQGGIAVDAAGNAFVTGWTASSNFPTTAGAFQTAGGGANDAFVTKLNATGSALVYSTYLGGDTTDVPSEIAVDAAGNAYVAGFSRSANFPTTLGAFQTGLGGESDGFLSKLNPTGSALVYSTYLGASDGDVINGLAIDAAGNGYVTGYTRSSNFPTTAGAFQTVHGGGPTDGFVAKLNSTATALLYSTYLGGSGDDAAAGIAVDAAGNAYVTGQAGSSNFPTTAGAFQTVYGGGSFDGFVTKLNPTATAIVLSTYLGGADTDAIGGIAVEAAGSISLVGQTSSSNFPTTPGALQTGFGGVSDAFVTVLEPAGGLDYSTYLGGDAFDGAGGIVVDAVRRIYIGGATGSSNFPVTSGAAQTTFGGGTSDIFVAVLDRRPAVAILAAEISIMDPFVEDVRNKLIATGRFSAVDAIDVQSTTPTVAQLQAYRSVLVWSDFSFADSNGLGDNLHAYLTAGGGVVIAVFTNVNGITLGGAFASNVHDPANGDYPLTVGNNTSGTTLTLGTIHVPGSPLMAGVTAFNGGAGSYHGSSTLAPGAISIADYSNGIPLVATKLVNDAPVVALNFWPPSSDARADLWLPATDGTRLMANALLNAGGVTSTSVTSDTNPSVLGQNVTFTATVASPGDTSTGTVQFTFDGVALGGPIAVAGGTATLTISGLAIGTHPVVASFTPGAGSALVSSTSSALGQTVNQASATTTLISSANPSAFGQNVTFTATVAVVSPGVGTPTGTVAFKDGSTTLGTGPLNSSGIATFATATLAPGPHSITAVYGGDTNFVASTSSALSQTVNHASTTTALSSSANPSVFGQAVTFTATVGVVSPGAGTPTGTVAFKDGSTTLGTGPLNSSGIATFATATLAPGPHSIIAVYGGDTNFVTSTSSALSQVVNQASTTTTLNSPVNPSVFGQAVTFTATVAVVSPGAGTPTGTVAFKDGSTTLGTGPLNGSGIAAFATATLAPGPHSIIAVYGGDTNFVTSTSSALSQVVNQAGTATTIGSSLNPSTFGQAVTFTATVAVVSPGAGTPTGTVAFKDGSTTLGTAALTGSGIATFTTTTLSAGTHSITAVYGGDTNFSTSTSIGVSQIVVKADQTITFGALPNRAVDAGPFTVSATATSNLPIAFTLQTPAVCALSGSTVTTLAVGTCTILASQGGDGNYNAATPVPRSFTVLPNCATVTILPGSLATALAGAAYSQTFSIVNGASPATFTFTGALPSGLTFSNGVMSGTPSGKGVFPITVTATDANACQVSASFTLGVSPQRRFVAGAGGGASTVRALTLSGTIASEFTVYAPGFTGGVPVAQGDLNGDGVADIITGSGPTGEPRVNLIDGATNAVVASYLAFDPAIRGGVEVAAGDVTGDGVPEILAAPGCDGPLAVRAFDVRTGMLVREYPAGTTASGPPAWGCGLHVAAGDVNGDGVADLVVGSGSGGSPFVAVIDGYTGATLREFLPYPAGFPGGVYVAAADVTGDGIADIVTGAGPGGGPHVRVFDGRTGDPIAGPLASFYAYEAAFAGGVRVAAGDLNGDGRAELITGAGPGGGPHVRVFDGASGTEILGAYAFDASMTGGVFVAAPPPIARMAIDLPVSGASSTTIRIAGWALRQIAIDADGTDVIHAWAYPVAGGVPVFVGATTERVARADVAYLFGGEFLMSGFDFTGTLAPGTYDLVVFARNARSLRFDQLRIVRITVD